jgi:hypothetical protein
MANYRSRITLRRTLIGQMARWKNPCAILVATVALMCCLGCGPSMKVSKPTGKYLAAARARAMIRDSASVEVRGVEFWEGGPDQVTFVSLKCDHRKWRDVFDPEQIHVGSLPLDSADSFSGPKATWWEIPSDIRHYHGRLPNGNHVRIAVVESDDGSTLIYVRRSE